MKSDGTDKRPLGLGVDELQGPAAPTWSPTGTDVAYTLVRLIPGTDSECASWSVVVRNAASGADVVEFRNALSPTWAPHATKIAVESNPAHCKQPGAIGVLSLSGNGRQVFDRLGSTTPAWSPDGRWLAFYCWSTTRGLCVVGPDGRHFRRLSGGGPSDLDWPAPTWSPDGKKVVFATARRRVKILTVSSGRSRSLGVGVAPSWSPNGKSIALFSRGTLTVRDATTGKGHVVTRVDGGFELVPPSWSPDGKRLYFTSR
jgi:Tol biopolymer transport system component